MNFFYQYKKIILASGFIIIVFVLGYMMYSFFFKPSMQPVPQTSTLTSAVSGGLPLAQEGKGNVIGTTTASSANLNTGNNQAGNNANQISQLANTETVGAIRNGTNLQFYNKNDGKFYTIDNNGNMKTLSDTVFHDVTNVTWSPDKTRAILEYPDDSKIIYDFNANKQITLPSHWQDFNFSPDGNGIVFKSMGTDPNNHWLAVTDGNGANARRIENIGSNGDKVYPLWSPNNQMVAMYTEGIDFNRQNVYFVGLNNENFKSIVVDGRGFQPKWDPDGNRLLYSTYSTDTDMKPNLWIETATGNNAGSDRQDLQIQTWANKCTFGDTNTLYCAVPQNLPEGAGIFPELAQNSQDQLYQINLQTGAKKEIATPDGSYNMSDLIVSGDGSYLYFTDSSSDKLYKVKIK